MEVADQIQLALALRIAGCGGRLDEAGSLVSGELPDGVRAEAGPRADPLDGLRLTEWDLLAVDELAAAASDFLPLPGPAI